MSAKNSDLIQQAPPISLSTEDAAKALGLEPKTLANWRHRGKGPAYFHTSDSPKSPVLYLYDDLKDWAHSHKRIGGVC